MTRFEPVRRALLGMLCLCLIAVLSACGTTTTTTQPGSTSTSSKSAQNATQTIRLSAEADTPSELAQALRMKKPVVILIYVPGGADDELVRKSLQKIAPKYPDVTFLTYDYKKPDEYGDILMQLGIDYPPVVAFVTGDGVVEYQSTGFVDEAVLTQHVVNIREL